MSSSSSSFGWCACVICCSLLLLLLRCCYSVVSAAAVVGVFSGFGEVVGLDMYVCVCVYCVYEWVVFLVGRVGRETRPIAHTETENGGGGSVRH